MIFRRRPSEEDAGPEETDVSDEPIDDESLDDEPDEVSELEQPRRKGPWDRTESTADRVGLRGSADGGYVDFGGVVVPVSEGLELQVQVDEASGAVAGLLLAAPDSAVEIRAFAAPRTESLWDDVRKQIAGEAGRLGGTATEVDGEFGIELKVMVPVPTGDGGSAPQLSRVVGVDGPRWLLRGSFYGRSAVEPDPDGVIERAFHDVIVVRGDDAMLPGEMIPLQLPEPDEPGASGAETTPEAADDDETYLDDED